MTPLFLSFPFWILAQDIPYIHFEKVLEMTCTTSDKSTQY